MDLTGHGIIFDKDGTLFDFSASWSACSAQILRTLAGEDAPLLDRMARAVGFDMDRQVFAVDSIIIAATGEDVAQVLADASGLALPDVRLIMHSETMDAKMVPAAPLHPFLTSLRDMGAKLAVVTNDSAAAATAHLADAGVTSLFDSIVGYDSGYGAKPQPGPCEGAARELGLSADKCTMVGDSTHDLIAGRSAGMRCVGVLTGIADERELGPFADVVLPSIAALPDWLARHLDGSTQ